MLGPFWKEHFSLKQLYFFREDPAIFVACQWQEDKTKPNLKYLIYRTLMTLIFFVTWFISIVRESGPGKWPIFLTNWGYTLCTAQAILVLVMLAFYFLSDRFPKMSHLRSNISKIYPFYWIINTVATSTAFGITIIYWSVIFEAKKVKFNAMNYFVHGNNSILMMLDLFMVAHPIRILHFVYTVLFAFLYTIFSIIYYSFGGTGRDGSRCIYKIVDWDNPFKTSLTCLAVMVFLIFLHMVAFSISILRKSLERKFCYKHGDVVASANADTKRHAAYVNEGISNEIV